MLESSIAVSMGEIATDFCPTPTSCGYFARGAFAIDKLWVFKWFETPKDLTDHLLEIETLMFELDRQELKALYQVLWPLLQNMENNSFTPDLREEINLLLQEQMSIEWWGSFEDLAFGPSAFAAKVRKHFRFQELELSDAPLKLSEQAKFIEYLRYYGMGTLPSWQPWFKP